ncbi:hypothetical protein [Sphingobium bisphenolivorans]|uniref:hypothetical protein n=1 Tax=Sphingobium bisphenolivorans TaxID=1335760 RepID=UPI00187BE472|nr:hypothetical protein [Sphingobium bisphenolivorans]
MATLVRVSQVDARLYEECRLHHAGVVNAYVESRAEILRHNDGHAPPSPARADIIDPP